MADNSRLLDFMRRMRDLRPELADGGETEDGMQRLAMGLRYRFDGHPEATEAQQLLDEIWPTEEDPK